MAGHIIRKNDNVNLVLEFEDETELPAYTMEDCAHALWNRGLGDHGTEEEPIVWEDLVEQDWIDILYMYSYSVIMNMAGDYQFKTFGAAGREAAQAVIDERHDLGS